MILKTVTFDRLSYHWENNIDYNLVFLHAVEQNVNDIVRHRGYIYLNQICEILGVQWNSDDDNPCIKNDGVDRIAFIQFETFRKPNNSVEVRIFRYD